MICVNSHGYHLTLGCYYEVQFTASYSDGDYIAVINDNGVVKEYPAECFA